MKIAVATSAYRPISLTPPTGDINSSPSSIRVPQTRDSYGNSVSIEDEPIPDNPNHQHDNGAGAFPNPARKPLRPDQVAKAGNAQGADPFNPAPSIAPVAQAELPPLRYCNDFQTGACRRGVNCKYDHVIKPKELCRAFQHGTCPRGNLCPHIHKKDESKRPARPAQPRAQTANSLLNVAIGRDNARHNGEIDAFKAKIDELKQSAADPPADDSSVVSAGPTVNPPTERKIRPTAAFEDVAPAPQHYSYKIALGFLLFSMVCFLFFSTSFRTPVRPPTWYEQGIFGATTTLTVAVYNRIVYSALAPLNVLHHYMDRMTTSCLNVATNVRDRVSARLKKLAEGIEPNPGWNAGIAAFVLGFFHGLQLRLTAFVLGRPLPKPRNPVDVFAAAFMENLDKQSGLTLEQRVAIRDQVLGAIANSVEAGELDYSLNFCPRLLLLIRNAYDRVSARLKLLLTGIEPNPGWTNLALGNWLTCPGNVLNVYFYTGPETVTPAYCCGLCAHCRRAGRTPDDNAWVSHDQLVKFHCRGPGSLTGTIQNTTSKHPQRTRVDTTRGTVKVLLRASRRALAAPRPAPLRLGALTGPRSASLVVLCSLVAWALWSLIPEMDRYSTIVVLATTYTRSYFHVFHVFFHYLFGLFGLPYEIPLSCTYAPPAASSHLLFAIAIITTLSYLFPPCIEAVEEYACHIYDLAADILGGFGCEVIWPVFPHGLTLRFCIIGIETFRNWWHGFTPATLFAVGFLHLLFQALPLHWSLPLHVMFNLMSQRLTTHRQQFSFVSTGPIVPYWDDDKRTYDREVGNAEYPNGIQPGYFQYTTVTQFTLLQRSAEIGRHSTYVTDQYYSAELATHLFSARVSAMDTDSPNLVRSRLENQLRSFSTLGEDRAYSATRWAKDTLEHVYRATVSTNNLRPLENQRLYVYGALAEAVLEFIPAPADTNPYYITSRSPLDLNQKQRPVARQIAPSPGSYVRLDRHDPLSTLLAAQKRISTKMPEPDPRILAELSAFTVWFLQTRGVEPIAPDEDLGFPHGSLRGLTPRAGKQN
jgi:hypothetical protein